ncbi:conjugative transfer signal peptidase TraF [Piscinibacter gummiphilus]|uniref:Signal peptidase I n=1 Tax=Piscinibacter gummiphilus TaxID=946333 RepID=A0ABZ0D1T0_9BURK|nr:conjugative transfer signal peptidase TraF [Piscinibacter gummiphilus]WOB11132.1 conjugative transfer signal peptidase TraF [Piscinibacter gummiphilus]
MNHSVLHQKRRFSLTSGARLLLSDARRRWYLFVLLAVIWMLAGWRLLVGHAPLLPILFNWTDSLPYSVAYVDYTSKSLSRGDFIVYAFSGEAAQRDYPGLLHQPFFKRIVGVPGDQVTTKDRDVFVNGTFVGRAKTHTKDKKLQLQPIGSVLIPPGHFYVQGTSPDSFDSRYANSGLVSASDVAAKVHPLF